MRETARAEMMELGRSKKERGTEARLEQGGERHRG